MAARSLGLNFFIGTQVFGTNTTEDAVDAFSPDTEGTSATGTRTCYAVNILLAKESKLIPSHISLLG